MTRANQAEYDAWNGDSGRRWVTDPDRRDHVMQSVAAALLEAADLTVGDVVLDLGCGCGATAVAAARTVGADGSVLGVDLSEPMLDVARQRVVAARLPNVTVLQADAQTHPFDPGGHDIAISRFGTMFFDDPAAAFSNIARSIRHGGRLFIATWQPLVANDWLTIPGAALLRYSSLPEPAGSAPGMFAQSDPDIVRGVLERSGFGGVDVQPATVTLRLGADPDEATAHLADTGIGRAALATIPDDDHTAALDAVRSVLAEHIDTEGVQLDGAILLTSAARV
jgi:SAM-dependent methyltransferase